MATNFPTSVDSFTDPTSGSAMNSPSHAAQHANANDAVEAIEAFLGASGANVQGSAVKDKGGQVFNVKAYGTGVGTGSTTTDTAALTAAAAAMVAQGYGVIQFPAGVFHISSWPQFTTLSDSYMPYAIQGMGKYATYIFSHATSLATSLGITNPTFSSVPSAGAPEWGGCTIDGTNATGTAVGINWCDVGTVTFEQMGVTNFTGASQSGMLFQNILGWTEQVALRDVDLSNNTNNLHFAIASGGYPSFDYWTLDHVQISLNANQNGWVDEVSAGTLLLPGTTQHYGCKIHINSNASTGGTNTGSLFLLKGNSVFTGGCEWAINGEVDGAGTAHQGFAFQQNNGLVAGDGSISLPGFANWVNPSGASSPWQMTVTGAVNIPGVPASYASGGRGPWPLGNGYALGGGRLWSGSGSPASGGSSSLQYTPCVAGDVYFRTDTPGTVTQRIYICTVSGTPGTWVATAA